MSKYIKVTYNSDSWYWWLNRNKKPLPWVFKPKDHKYLIIIKQVNDYTENIINAITLNDKDQLLLLRDSLMDTGKYNAFYDYVRKEYKPVSNDSLELEHLTKVSQLCRIN